MQISANTSVKTIEGHYTCHTKSVITKPQNVMVMRDIMCNGYVAGANCDFFGMEREGDNKPKTDAKGNHLYNASQIQHDINSRLTMSEGEDYTYPSMLALAEEYNSPATRDQVISVSNRVLPWDSTAGTNFDHFPGGKTAWGGAGQVGLDTIHYGEDLRATTNQDFIAASTVNNSVCFLGPHRVYSQWSSTYQELVPGQGHFGPDALPGVRAQLACNLRNVRNSNALLTRTPASTGCPLAPRRVGVARVGAQRDDGHRGGGALAACLPEPPLSRRWRRWRRRQDKKNKKNKKRRGKRERGERREKRAQNYKTLRFEAQTRGGAPLRWCQQPRPRPRRRRRWVREAQSKHRRQAIAGRELAACSSTRRPRQGRPFCDRTHTTRARKTQESPRW